MTDKTPRFAKGGVIRPGLCPTCRHALYTHDSKRGCLHGREEICGCREVVSLDLFRFQKNNRRK